MSLLADFPSTTVEITIGYLTRQYILRKLISTTVEITIGYLTKTSSNPGIDLQQ